MAQTVKRLPTMRETWAQFLGQEDPLEKEMATHSSILAWKILWIEELAGCSPWGHKESDTTERLHSLTHSCLYTLLLDFPGGSDGKASAYNAGHLGSIPGSGRSPGEGNGNPLQYSCLENPMDGGTW